MNWFEALILGLVQGLTEFLPVSSSGHLEIGKAILQIEARENLTFSIVVHGATVLSILVVFWRDLRDLVVGSLSLNYNESNSYLLKIIISMIPVGIVGAFFKEEVEAFFTGNIVLVGSMLLITATLLVITNFIRAGERKIGYLDALIIGVSQALAVMPGISRSGATITTALFLGNKRDEAARFSFLMVILPILAANFLDLKDMEPAVEGSIGIIPLVVGFLAAFISGLMACKWMLSIVRKGKLIWFGLYCLVVGSIAIAAGLSGG
jgi:undecaprenyl-diphosphatase